MRNTTPNREENMILNENKINKISRAVGINVKISNVNRL
jgi:hypothetical protein